MSDYYITKSWHNDNVDQRCVTEVPINILLNWRSCIGKSAYAILLDLTHTTK